MTEVVALCFKEVTRVSIKDYFAKQVSVLDALQTAWYSVNVRIHLSNSSEFLQQKPLHSEIQTKLTSAIACAVIQREAGADKS